MASPVTRATVLIDAVAVILAHSSAHAEDAQGAIRYILDAHPGEPLFVIRGRDALAVPVLRRGYMEECRTHSLHDQEQRALRHLVRFIQWQAEFAKLTHLPDPIPNPNNPNQETLT